MGKVKYTISVATGAAECLTASGIVFGWSSIAYVLTKEGYMRQGCDSELSCDRQQAEQLAFIFTIATVVLNFSTYVNGWLLDNFGTRALRLLASALFLAGSVLMVVATPETSILIYPAMCCFGVGGIQLLTSNIQLGGLFPASISSIICGISGAMDSSSVLFVLVKILYDFGVSLQTSFLFISTFTVFQLVRTFFLMPADRVPQTLPRGYDYGVCSKASGDVLPVVSDVTESEEPEKAQMSFIDCLRELPFWLNCFQLSVLQLLNFIYMGSLNAQLSTMAAFTGGYLNIFGICQSFGIFFAPLNGALADRLTSHFAAAEKVTEREVKCRAVGISSAVTFGLALAFSVCRAVPFIEAQYFTFLLQVVFRSFMYGANANFLATFYPSEHFGKLFGVTLTVGAAVGLLQFPAYAWIMGAPQMHEVFRIVNAISVLMTLATFVHPLYLLREGYAKSECS